LLAVERDNVAMSILDDVTFEEGDKLLFLVSKDAGVEELAKMFRL
jgi:hypothetical protein